VRTASSTVLPVPLVARSIAHARLKSSVMPALSAAIKARTHMADVAACEVMRFKRIAGNVETGFHGCNSIIDN
jgi:hypothetical protein